MHFVNSETRRWGFSPPETGPPLWSTICGESRNPTAVHTPPVGVSSHGSGAVTHRSRLFKVRCSNSQAIHLSSFQQKRAPNFYRLSRHVSSLVYLIHTISGRRVLCRSLVPERAPGSAGRRLITGQPPGNGRETPAADYTRAPRVMWCWEPPFPTGRVPQPAPPGPIPNQGGHGAQLAPENSP